MAKKKYYNRKYMKQYYAAQTWISNDGLHVERDYKDAQTGEMKTYEPKIKKAPNGQHFIVLSKIGVIPIDLMVISCYCPPKPNNNKQYVIHHKDWNFKNDHYTNLEWVEDTSQYQNQKLSHLKMQWYKDRHIDVKADGTIIQDKQPLHINDSFYDPDLDWTYHYTHPDVRYSYKDSWGNGRSAKLDVDEIMEDFGFVEGDKESFTEPVILHKNNDYLDFTPGNLEWCEKDDQRYKEYQKVAHDKKMQRDHDCNYWLSPGSWTVIYGDNEPYQDWSDRPGKFGRKDL